jgi:hypothetical protein
MLLFENVLVHVDWKSGVWVSSQNRTIQSYWYPINSLPLS